MPFCYSPWTNIDIGPRGNISPCCKFRHDSYADVEQKNIITSDLQDYTSSELLNDIKKDFLNDQWPAGCIRCRTEEENGIQSKRQLDYERWQEHYNNYDQDTDGFLTASVGFGNTCNLKCITCGSGSSSRWYKEYKLIYNKAHKPNHFYKENFVQDLINSCPELIHLDIPGGEPFLSGVDQQKELLDYYIETGQAENISIHYTTNGQEYPDSSWWNRWQHFKEIDLQLSVDGIGSRYEYIRFPGDWSVFEYNTKQYLQAEKLMPNLRLSVSHTLSAYNVYYLDEFFSWCEQTGLPRPWVGRVHTPAHMRATVFPEMIRQQIVKDLMISNFEDVQTWARHLSNTDDSSQFDEFLSKTAEHDSYRSLDFTKTFPELAELIANLQK